MKIIFAIFSIVLCIAVPCLSQTQTTGVISGLVVDGSGAVVPKASITVLNRDTGLRRTTVTSQQGSYSVPLLDPGVYSITVVAKGFETVSQEGIEVAINHAVTVSFRLQVGHAEEKIIVSSRPLLIETDNPNTTTTLTADQIEDMPNPGNDLTYMATIAPGAIMNTISSGGYNGGSLEFDGLPTVANDFTIDGLSANNSWENSNQSGATGLMLGANAIEEVSINTQSYSVDQGRLGAAQLNYTTKSGTNQFHGNAYEIWNGSALNTTNYFIKANPAPPQKPRSNVNEFGASLGGPILKNKLFFFTDFEAIRIVLPSVQTATLPSSTYQSYVMQQLPIGGADPSTGVTLPAEPAEVPFYKTMFGLVTDSTSGSPLRAAGCPFDVGGIAPATGYENDGNGCALRQLRSFSNPLNETLWTIRTDYTHSNADSFWFRFQLDNGKSITPNLVNSLFDIYDNQPTRNASAGWTHTFRPNLVNQFNPGLSYIDRVHDFSDYDAAVTAMPIAVESSVFSTFGASNTPYGDRNLAYQFTDNLIWNISHHNLKLGVNFLRNLYTSAESAGFKIPFAELISLPEFTYGASAVTLEYFPTYVDDHMGTVNMDFYAADTWHITRRLTANYGLRMAWNANPVSFDKVISRLAEPFEELSHDASSPLNQAILGNLSHLFESTPLFVYQPRAGVAFQAANSTVFRAGGGIFTSPAMGFLPTYADENAPSMASFETGLLYDQSYAIFPGVPGSTVDQAAQDNNAFHAGFYNGELSCGAPQATANCIPAITYYDLETAHKFKYPIYYQWNAGVEQQFGATRLVTVKYVGTRSTQGFYIRNPNAYQTACDGCWGSYPYNETPDTRFGDVFSFRTGTNSAYHSLQASFEQRLSHGLDLRLNYTWSHCLDNGSNGGVEIFQDNTDFYAFDGQLSRYWANCDYDVRNSLNGSYSYALPLHSQNHLINEGIGGWKIAGNIYARGGFPFSVYSAYPTTIRNSSVQYDIFANRVAGVTPYAKHPLDGITTAGTIQWLNPEAFQSVVDPNTGGCYPENTPTYCQNGNLSRNSVRLPGFTWTDFSISKQFPITERVNFRFETQFFNLFNHPNFGLPTSSTGYAGNPIAGILSEPATLDGFGVINTTVGPSTGLLGTPSVGGDSSVRMIAFRGVIKF